MTTESQLQQSDQLVLFRVANEELAISIHAVQEIIRPPLITRVPRAPQYVDGMGNLRGEILPIINLRLFLGLSAKENDEQTRIVVVNVNGAITGIVVDSVSEVLTIDRRILEAPPATARNVNGEFLKNIAKAENGKRLILILDETRLQVDEHLAPLAAAEADSSLATVHAADHAGQEQSEIEQLVTFQISHEEYALPIMQVKEIIKLVDIVPVPNAPEYVLGVISLRDHLLPIIDLKLRFRKRSKADATEASDESKRIVVVYIDGERTGILVDSVSQVLRLEKNKVDAPPNLIKQDGVDCLLGVGKLEEGKRLIMLLDAPKLIERNLELGSVGPVQSGDETMETTLDTVTDEVQLVCFRLNQEEYAFNIMQVQEIIRLRDVTSVPNTKEYVEGIINLRGAIVPIVDMRRRFGLNQEDRTEQNRIVISHINGMIIGFIVDAVSEVLRISRRSVEPPPEAISGVQSQFIDGVGKLNEGQRMLIMVNLDSLMSDYARAA